MSFIPDEEDFGKYRFIDEYIKKMMWNYCYLNPGLTIIFNGDKFYSENGLLDLLEEKIDAEILYPIIHLKKETDIEIAITHCKNQYSEQYYSFVNGQYTVQGDTSKRI